MAPKSRKRRKAGASRPPQGTRSVGDPPRQRTGVDPPRQRMGLAELMPLLPVSDGLSHPQALQHPSRSAARIVLGLALCVMTYLVVPSVVFRLVMMITFPLVGSGEFSEYVELGQRGHVPEGLLASNLSIGAMIAVCWALMRWINLAPPGLLFSVVRRIRWGYLLACAGVALLVFGVVQTVSLGLAGVTFRMQPQFWWFMLVVVLTSPLQAAAEEVLFRGFLQQGIGSAARAWWVGVVVTSLLFAFAHGVQSPALFVDRLVFGLVAGVLVWRTGGLEAGIGTHVVNNILAWLLAALTSSIAEVREIRVLGWDKAAADVATFGAIAVGCWLVARLMRLRRRTGQESGLHKADPGLGDPASIG